MNHRLKTVFDQIWGYLDEGVQPQSSAFSLGQVATIGLNGSPKLRSIILRNACKTSNELMFNTDSRSAKAAEIKANPGIALTFYDRTRDIQLRFEGKARLITDGQVKLDAWNNAKEHTLVQFRNPSTPASIITTPEDAHHQNTENQDSMQGYENFCLAVIDVFSIDCLDINSSGHSRARYTRTELDWQGQWIAP